MLSKRALMMGLAGLVIGSAAHAARAPEAAPIRFSEWTDEDPPYLFYPADKLEVQVPSAPELNRATQVGQDGRITLPLVGQVMAAFKSAPDLQAEITELYRPYLRHPEVTVFPGDTGNTRVLVGGEVRNPGWVEMPGDFDALSAALAAGGFTNAAKSKQALILRRGPDGTIMQRLIDLRSPLKGKASEAIALRRYDIVYVPKTRIAEAGTWVEQNINNIIPAGIMNWLLYSQN
ncbi:polysaccharide biosynthesis/export family protein [Asticcacaulis sp. AND118]|uniref:polysaccharide biosynthesis/export family protein n=1 Tax=Asticcacaulis sp. AND118 TaxID=2840468 RepID=UPI001CFFF0DE|nr:polysaccharide biosynthesis/export family protein [Asticcacaulis sp. AND118]UDF04594.1 polysaccharide export protein [Asticcacaulis sp. AND118]